MYIVFRGDMDVLSELFSILTAVCLISFQLLCCPRYWALAVPAYGCVAFVVTMALYFGGNMFIVPDITDIRNITG